jgi:hypothetical protein
MARVLLLRGASVQRSARTTGGFLFGIGSQSAFEGRGELLNASPRLDQGNECAARGVVRTLPRGQRWESLSASHQDRLELGGLGHCVIYRSLHRRHLLSDILSDFITF